MANSLTKDAEYVPNAIPYGPGSPGTLAQPGYYTYERVTTPVNLASVPIDWQYAWVNTTDAQGNHIQVLTLISRPGSLTTTQRAVSSINPLVAIWHPPVPATPPVAGSYPALVPNAWNSSAHSAVAIGADADCEFTALANMVGGVVGLSGTATSEYRAIEHGLYFHNGLVQPIQSGVVVAGTTTYAPTDVWMVRRRGTVVTIRRNGSLYYTSAVPSAGVKTLQASLYAASDAVYDASIADVLGSTDGGAGVGRIAASGYLTGAFLPMRGTVGRSLQSLPGVFLPMQGTATAKGHGSLAGSFRPMAGVALRKDTYGTVAGVFISLDAAVMGSGLVPTAPATVHAVSLPLIGVIRGLTGEIGHVTGSLRYMDGMIGRRYAKSNGAFLPLVGQVAGYATNEAFMDTYATSDVAMTAATFLVVNADSTGTATSAFVVDVMVPATMDSMGTVTTDWVLSQIDTALLDSTATIYDLAALGTALVSTQDGLPPGVSVWVLNVDTKASTRYTNFNYNSFASRAGRLYGAKADGIYLLEGDDDDGTEIAASLAVGVTSLPSARDASMAGSLKRVPAAYLGVASDKTMYLKVLANGGEFLYRARSENAALMQQRVDIGRGLRAVYWSFEVYNSEGSDFDLESIEFVPVKLSRRV